MTKNFFKGVGAILVGVLVGAVLSIVTDLILESTGVYPSMQQQATSGGFHIWWMVLLAIVYRTLYTILSGYVGAWLAPSHPMRYAIALGIIAFAANILGLIVTWNQNLGPAYYPIVLAVLAFPAAWYGGKLRTRKM